jgi:hypothetical protein
MPRGRRVRGAVVGLGLALAWGTVAPDAPAFDPPEAGRQADGPEILPYKSRSFRIPFSVEPADRGRIKEVQLWVSTDQGKTWKAATKTTPEQAAFPTFRAPRDGEYWFAVRTLDTKDRLYPTDDDLVEPSMKVVVDTTPPTLELATNGRRGSRASIRWEIRDKHLDPKTLTIQYKAPGALDWRQVPIHDYALIGAEEWEAGTAAALLVRASVDDTAGNRAEAEITLADGIAAAPDDTAFDDRRFEAPPPITPISSPSRPAGRMGGVAEPGDPFVRNDQSFDPEFDAPAASTRTYANPPPVPEPARTLLVASPRFALQYAVDDAGPDGPALVELWITRDGGQTWNRQMEDADRTSPYDVDLGSEGTYGLWLVVQSAANLGDPPPRPGDRPQMWVEVDSTAPIVRLDSPRVGTGANLGKVLINWRASDPHLGPRPVLLSYRADRHDAPWTPITDRLDNTGRYVWTVPPNVPPRIHLRIDVVDSIGNRGFAETQSKPVLVDRSRPRGRILGLDPNSIGGGNRPEGRSRR